MTQVGEAWMPSLCSMLAARRPLAAPGRPSSSTSRLQATKSDIPFTPAGAPGNRASTRWTMFSAPSCSPQVMKIFSPESSQPPCPSGSARVRMSPRSVPAWASVRFMVPDHSPEISLGR
jgi:hypothetical protein